MRRTMAEAAEAMGGAVVQGDPETVWSGASLDSRTLRGGELFFALEGSRRDGHDYVAAALEAGAAGVVVHREVAARGCLVRVEDTYRALHDLTRHLRRQAPDRLVAVTGSVGKTTTKELLARLLARRYRVAASPGNLNNLYGFPLALMAIPDDTEWMVAEMGMSTPGELRGISELGQPDAAVFTNVRPVHLEGLGSVEAVAEAKAELLAGLAPEGVVVANADDPWVMDIARRHSGPVVRFGRAADAEYRILDLRPLAGGTGSSFRLATPEGEAAVELPLLGEYNAMNFLAAAATACSFGVPVDEVAAAARDARPVAGRGIVRRTPEGSTVVDDTYNANPAAVERALEATSLLPGRRRWAILGDMLELGPRGPEFHRQAGRRAAELGFDPVVGVGELSRETVRGAEESGVGGTWVEDAEGAAELATEELRPGDVLLVKGSRGIGLEAVIAALGLAGEEG